MNPLPTDSQLGIECHNHCEAEPRDNECSECRERVTARDYDYEDNLCITCKEIKDHEAELEYRETLPQRILNQGGV